MSHSLELIAHHEAGHAVMACRFGQCFNTVSIIPDGQREGSCLTWAVEGQAKMTIEQEALKALAGHAAQKYFHPDDESEPCITDYRHVWNITESMPREKYRALFTTVDRLVIENEAQIHAVAEALLECKTLDGALASVIIDHVDSGADWRQSIDWIVYKQFHS